MGPMVRGYGLSADVKDCRSAFHIRGCPECESVVRARKSGVQETAEGQRKGVFNRQCLKDAAILTGLPILEEEKLEELKNIIRTKTENFKKIEGGMYCLDIKDYEGSF